VPLARVRENPEHLRILETWLRSYRPDELFDEQGAPADRVLTANLQGSMRMSASPHANGGLLAQPLNLPDFREFGLPVLQPGTERAESTGRLGARLAEIYRRNPRTFRLSALTRQTATASEQSSRSLTVPSWSVCCPKMCTFRPEAE
jgi:xylulose-5-phosphate/fructose-6-phosphate phosphoketolase